MVCRRQPASAIATKACPGLRSGIDFRLVHPTLNFVFPAIKSMPRTRIRGWNPEGVERGKTTRRWKKTDPSPPFHPCILLVRDNDFNKGGSRCGLHKTMVIPYPRRRIVQWLADAAEMTLNGGVGNRGNVGWAMEDSNLRPHGCKPCALAN